MIATPKEAGSRKSQWCIVIADDHAPDRLITGASDLDPAPVQYSCLGGSATLLHMALHRAAAIAPPSQILVTALQEYRNRWEPTLWFVRPEMRFVGKKGTSPLLTSAAAILSIATVSASSIVTILPARCYVGHEWILRQALRQAVSGLRQIPEGAATLGMMDIDAGVDEDYLVVNRTRPWRGGLTALGIARRPTAWVARHLRRQGALVSSGILIGYAGVLAAHISKHWPGISEELMTGIAAAGAAPREFEISDDLQRVPPSSLRSLRWQPPAFPQQVFAVYDSGWSGLKSPYAVDRIADFWANRADRRPPSLISSTPSNQGSSSLPLNP